MDFDILNELANKKIKFINENKEALIEAWIAETGLLPSESVLVISTSEIGTIRCWIEKKYQFNPIA